MLDGLTHRHSLVNGYSGFFPEGDAAFRRRLRTFPDEISLAALGRRDVGWAIVARPWFTPARRSRSLDTGIVVAFESEDAYVLRLP